jgi:hypothetical protein
VAKISLRTYLIEYCTKINLIIIGERLSTARFQDLQTTAAVSSGSHVLHHVDIIKPIAGKLQLGSKSDVG